MIHSDTLKSLTEDEYLMLYALCERIFNNMGMSMNPHWIKMMRVNILLNYLMNINNIKDEFICVRDSLATKLQQAGF